MSTLNAWSYSRWDNYNTCPLMFKYKVLDKLDTGPQSAAMLKGQHVHKVLADYLMAPEAGPAPSEAGKAAPVAEELRRFDNKVVEQQWGFTNTWAPTGWFGKDTWFRSVLDVGLLYPEDMTAEVIDWKTGKPRGTHEDQMELFAMSVMLRIPGVVHVTTRLVYTDYLSQEIMEHPATDLPALKVGWEARVAPMFEDTTFLPKPGQECGRCPFSRSNAGGRLCRYG